MSRFITELNKIIAQPTQRITGTVIAVTEKTVRVKTARGTREFTRVNAVDYKPSDTVRIMGDQVMGKVRKRRKFHRYLV